MPDVQCQTVTVTITTPEDGTITLTVPAYTVSLSAFVTRAHSILRTYVARSLQQREPFSVGDYALHLLSVAAADPRTQSQHMPDSTTAIPDDAARAFLRSPSTFQHDDTDRIGDPADER